MLASLPVHQSCMYELVPVMTLIPFPAKLWGLIVAAYD